MDDEDRLWRECVQWLIRWDVIPPTHFVNSSEAKPIDLAHLLSDGVLLCYVALQIDGTCIPTRLVTGRVPMPKFNRIMNLMLFLTACKEHLGLKKESLFDPSMLNDSTQFGEVLAALSVFSHCPKAQAHGIGGFPIGGVIETVNEAIYDILHPNTYSVAGRSSQRNSPVGLIYDKFSNFSTSLIPVSPVVSDPSTIDDQTDEFRLAKNDAFRSRQPVIREIILTEKRFITVMKDVERFFRYHLTPHLIGDQDRIISILSAMIQTHQTFYNELVLAPDIRQWLEQMKPDKYIKMLVHGDYIMELTAIKKTIENLFEKNPALNDATRNCFEKSPGGIEALLDRTVLPYQRLCRYPLLFNRLQQKTPLGNDEYDMIGDILKNYRQITLFTDHAKKNADDCCNLTDISERISGFPKDKLHMETLGSYLIDDDIKVETARESSQTQYLVLFAQKLVFCRKIHNTTSKSQPVKSLSGYYKYDSVLELTQYRLSDCPSVMRFMNWSNKWQLLHKTLGPQATITLTAKTDAIKDKWIRNFNKAYQLLEPTNAFTNQHFFQLTSFKNHTKCVHCQQLLYGFYQQGYKCLECGMASHLDCLNKCPKCLDPVSDLDKHAFYAGPMDRLDASHLLEKAQVGTFLLRVRLDSESGRRVRVYAISIKHDKVRHLKVQQESEMSGVHYFLHKSRTFPTIDQLIDYHLQYDLTKFFPSLKTSCYLKFPWKTVFPTAIVKCDFLAVKGNMLTVSRGQHIVIVNKKDDSSSLLLVRYGKQEGYVPKGYVAEWPEVGRQRPDERSDKQVPRLIETFVIQI